MGGGSGRTDLFEDVFGVNVFKSGDEVVHTKKLKHPKYHYLEIGKVYTVGYILTGNAISLIGIDVLHIGIFNVCCFKLVSEYKKDQMKLRLKKINYLKKPKWYKKIHKFITNKESRNTFPINITKWAIKKGTRLFVS